MKNIIDRVQLDVGCPENKTPHTVFGQFAKAVGVRARGMFDSANEPGQASATTDSMMGNLRDSQISTSKGAAIWS